MLLIFLKFDTFKQEGINGVPFFQIEALSPGEKKEAPKTQNGTELASLRKFLKVTRFTRLLPRLY